MPENDASVKCNPLCACECDTCQCKTEDKPVKLTPETAALVEEFGYREKGVQ